MDQYRQQQEQEECQQIYEAAMQQWAALLESMKGHPMYMEFCETVRFQCQAAVIDASPRRLTDELDRSYDIGAHA